MADAFMDMYRLESTCQIQLSAQAGGGELIYFGDEIYTGGDSAAAYVRSGGRGGSFVWPALLRKLDRIDTSYQD